MLLFEGHDLKLPCLRYLCLGVDDVVLSDLEAWGRGTRAAGWARGWLAVEGACAGGRDRRRSGDRGGGR